MEIRLAASDADLRSASGIYAESWKAAYRGIFSDKLLGSIQGSRWVEPFRRGIEAKELQIAILSHDGEDFGAGGFCLSGGSPEAALGEVTSIYFLQCAWGAGYAKPLIDYMLDALRALGCTAAHVWVLRQNARACRFYEKCGFALTAAGMRISVDGEEQTCAEYRLSLR